MILKFLLVFTVLLEYASSASVNMVENGCNAYDCKRSCINPNTIVQTPGDNGFRFEIEGLVDNKYVPNKIYKVSLVGSHNSLRNTYTQFRGFLIVAVPDTWYDAISFNPIGRFMISPNDREIRYTSGCNEMITHANFDTKKRVTFYWNAPKAGSGCVSFKAIVLQTDTVWLKDEGELTRTICEQNEDMMEKDVTPPCCACGEAKYTINFKGTWTRDTHPKDWPTNEGLIHWSNLIGATHSRNFSVWETGGYSSAGLKELAEFGIVRTLEDELKNSSNYGVIRNIFIANGLWFPNMEKEIDSVFTVSNSHHLMSFATMLGPSPDWFSGLSKLNLCLQNCTWVESYMEDLYPYDAGTDSGLSYNSPNKPTIPAEKIFRISSSYPNNIKSPFYDPSGKPMPPLAKLVIKRQMVRGAQCPNGQVESNQNIVNDPKEFEMNDLSNPIRRLQLINSEKSNFGKKSRTKSKETKLIDETDPKCMTTEWSQWSSCSSTCGNGLRRRSRQYKNPFAANGICREILEDIEMCLSENGECEEDQEETEMNSSDMCYMMTSWSSWSPCSASCGKGFTVRMRSYLKKELESRCHNQMEERRSCIINEKCVDENLISVTERKRICMLDKKPGPCRMAVSNVKYYYDRDMKKCLPFEYGGCRGNENNFETKEKCETICNIMTESSSNVTKTNSMSNQMSEQELAMKKKMCLQPAEEGQCYESQIKYYFDRNRLTCLPFEYSGCGGNDNNFNTIAACQLNCHPIIDKLEMKEKNSRMNVKLTIPEKKKICMSPAEKGTCSDSIQRYTYSVNMAKCLLFEYSGCEGNLNNFETIEECESVCDILIQMSKQGSAAEEEANLEIQKKEMCMQPLEKGPCMNYAERFYFNSLSGKCETFRYGGCFGNQNNFESLDECEATCHSLIESANNSKRVELSMEPKELSYHERKPICKYSVHEGSCNGRFTRYYYNHFSQNCEPFFYTGCGGNENNFITAEQCMKTCSNLDRNFTAEAMMRGSKMKSKMMLYPVNCRISEWTEWSNCSAMECGAMGETYRSRKILSEAQYGGKECPRNLNETQKCYKECANANKVDCQVEAWGGWSECKSTPGVCGGMQDRYRRVIRKPMNGGQLCPALKETRKCYLGPCSKPLLGTKRPQQKAN